MKGAHVGRHILLCVRTTVKWGQGRRVYVGFICIPCLGMCCTGRKSLPSILTSQYYQSTAFMIRTFSHVLLICRTFMLVSLIYEMFAGVSFEELALFGFCLCPRDSVMLHPTAELKCDCE